MKHPRIRMHKLCFNSQYSLLLLVLACFRVRAFHSSQLFHLVGYPKQQTSQISWKSVTGRSSSCLILSQGKNVDGQDFDDEDEEIFGRLPEYYSRDLQNTVEQQQRQINELLALIKQQQQMQPPQPPPTSLRPPPRSVKSTFATTPVPRSPSQLATASLSPLKAMLFVDGTWLYYSIHAREPYLCPIIKQYGKSWQRRYYFDWSALPRVICKALQNQDLGWAAQSRPIEIARVSVFTSYKADTSPNSYRNVQCQLRCSHDGNSGKKRKMC
jgi:hypothetical protein